MPANTPPVEVFFSYAHEDEPLKERLRKHLSPLEKAGLIRKWHDRMISAGQEWAGEIDAHLDASGVILLLVSSDFIDSEYCYGKEMGRALERHDAGEARVIPIILRHVKWRVGPLRKLQALPKDGRPVTDWEHEDAAFLNVAEGVQRVVQELNANPL